MHVILCLFWLFQFLWEGGGIAYTVIAVKKATFCTLIINASHLLFRVPWNAGIILLLLILWVRSSWATDDTDVAVIIGIIIGIIIVGIIVIIVIFVPEPDNNGFIEMWYPIEHDGKVMKYSYSIYVKISLAERCEVRELFQVFRARREKGDDFVWLNMTHYVMKVGLIYTEYSS